MLFLLFITFLSDKIGNNYGKLYKFHESDTFGVYLDGSNLKKLINKELILVDYPTVYNLNKNYILDSNAKSTINNFIKSIEGKISKRYSGICKMNIDKQKITLTREDKLYSINIPNKSNLSEFSGTIAEYQNDCFYFFEIPNDINELSSTGYFFRVNQYGDIISYKLLDNRINPSFITIYNNKIYMFEHYSKQSKVTILDIKFNFQKEFFIDGIIHFYFIYNNNMYLFSGLENRFMKQYKIELYKFDTEDNISVKTFIKSFYSNNLYSEIDLNLNYLITIDGLFIYRINNSSYFIVFDLN